MKFKSIVMRNKIITSAVLLALQFLRWLVCMPAAKTIMVMEVIMATATQATAYPLKILPFQ